MNEVLLKALLDSSRSRNDHVCTIIALSIKRPGIGHALKDKLQMFWMEGGTAFEFLVEL